MIKITRCKNLIIAILPLILIPTLYLAAYIYHKYIQIYILPCPIKMFLNINCPGCGCTRCIYSLLNGNLIKALKYNAAAVFLVILAFLRWIEKIFSLFGKAIKLIPRSNAFTYIASGTAVAYFILRNLIPEIAP